MAKSLYFTNRKEYWRRQKISLRLNVYCAEKKLNLKYQFETLYFINFELLDTANNSDESKVWGSLSSPHFISLHDGKLLIKNILPTNWNLTNFYTADEKNLINQLKTILIIMREHKEIINEVINDNV